ncbi:hypothetical protein NUITMVRA1_01060 [Aerococcus viridans]|uniref:phytoene desaturase family protein n=1 Tax=Aerococcus viridans TaxID=1377 RepID=UPI0028FDA855|nr:hypothetical protein NUITMVRA1_01060 [Aerococcus viridans]
MTAKERIAIIGAGIGGLSAAIRLQHAGYQVEIFEKESLPGGKMNQMAVDGYTFDVGPTIVMWPEAYRELFTLTGRDPEDYIPMQKLTPMYDVYFKGDPYRHYSVSNDLTDLMALMESKDPRNVLGFLQYLAEMYQRYQVAMDHFIISEDLDDNMARIFDGRLIDNPSIYLHVPSQVDETRAPEGKANFYLLMPVSELGTAQYAYDQSTVQFYKEKALETLARIPGLENLESQIEVERVFTPNDFESHYNAYRGATFGLQPTLMQSNHFRPQAKAENVSGLYFTGSSTHPGAGVPIVIESGKICADELMLDDEG